VSFLCLHSSFRLEASAFNARKCPDLIVAHQIHSNARLISLGQSRIAITIESVYSRSGFGAERPVIELVEESSVVSAMGAFSDIVFTSAQFEGP
jgi:hypothetical protein